MSRHADIFDFHIGRRVEHWLWHILRLDDVCELDMLMLEQLQYSDGLHWLLTQGGTACGMYVRAGETTTYF